MKIKLQTISKLNKINQKKKNYFWNTFAGIINAAEAVILSVIVTRVTGLIDAGILSIAFSVGNLLVCIGKFGVYNYQVTDVKREFTFFDYFIFRIVTTIFMFLAVIVYCEYGILNIGYNRHKIICVMMICLIYMIESIEDVFSAYYQTSNRLDLGCKAFCLRWGGIFLSFFIGIILLRDMAISLLISLVISLIIFLLYTCIVFPKIYRSEQLNRENNYICISKLKKMFTDCFPLFLTAFLSFYVLNAPKYAIDAVLEDSIQACYGFVSMPVFVIGLLNSFIYHPELVFMADEWNSDKNALRRRIWRQIIILLLISICCFMGAALIGCPVLSWLYNTDLSLYIFELLVLQVAGSFLGIAGYLSVILTIMRCQKDLIWGYIIVALIAFFSFNTVVIGYGIKGAAIEFTLLMVLLCSIYIIILIYRWKTAVNLQKTKTI